MYTSTTQVRVRYGETDQMGFLYYGHYALYYEVGRTDAIRQLGLTYKELEEMGIHMPVMELRSRYLKAARYDDLITIKTIIKELPASSLITFFSELYNEKEELLNKGETTLLFYDPVAKRRTTIPDELLTRLQPFFSETNPSTSSG